MLRILLVEDDERLSRLICAYLAEQGYQLSCAYSLAQAEQQLAVNPAELVILDLMLPDGNGLQFCQQLRPHFSGGIIVLTAVADDMDQVAALEMGADDFISKPIRPRVLLARIRAYERRLASQTKSKASQLELQASQRRARWRGEDLDLTDGEFDLLAFLYQHLDQVQTREALVRVTRGIDYNGFDRTIDAKVTSLRRKLGDSPERPNIIITVRGKGYLLASAGLL